MKKILLFTMAVTLFAACSVDMSVDVATQPVDVPEELYVSFDGEDTRIQLGEAGLPVWTKGDLVSVFYRSNANSKYQFTGETGDADGSIKLVEEGTATQPTSQIVAVYPYSTDYWFNWNTYNVEAFLPAEQTYCEDSFGVGSSIMVSSSEYKSLAFKNVCGWIKLQFTGNQIVETIAFKGNNGEQVAGEIYINTSDASCELASGMGSGEGVGGFIEEEGNVLTEVTLNCGEYGVQLDKNTPTAFYIALPPQTFEKGFSVTLTCQDDTTKTISTSNAITIERNHILPMGAIEVVMEVPSGNATFAANTITWNYTDDAEQDANLYDDSDETVAVYSRDIELSVAENNLPNGMTIDELIANSDDLLSVTVNGEASEDVALSVNSEGKYILHIDDFDWNTTYNIEFAYENTSELKGDKYAATLSTTVTTVGRENVAITLNGSSEISFVDNLSWEAFASGAPKVDLKQIYSTISAAYDISNFADAEVFLADVYSTYGYPHTTSDKIETYDADNKLLQTITDNAAISALWDVNDAYETSVGFSQEVITSGPHKVVYTRDITLWYGQTIQIVMTVDIVYPNWDFVHNTEYVSLSSGVYSSTVKPTRYPSVTSSALTGLDVALDLTAAFSVQDDGGNILTAEQLAANGLEVVFVVEDANTGVFVDENNVLYYYSNVAQVNVRGELYKVNADASSKTRITTTFDNGGLYSNYVVKTTTFVPFSTPTIKDSTAWTNVQVGKKDVFRIYLLDYINFSDYREGSTAYSLIDPATHSLLIGNGSNGYAKGVSVADMYKITISASISESNSSLISFDNTDNCPAVILDTTSTSAGVDADYRCTATINIVTPWGTYTKTLKVRFYKVS